VDSPAGRPADPLVHQCPLTVLGPTLFLLLLSFGVPASADTLTGTVFKVVDGDTLHLLAGNNTRHKIRLAGIDAPERGQAFGTKSKEHLATLVAGERVDVEWSKRDRYKRSLGRSSAREKT